MEINPFLRLDAGGYLQLDAGGFLHLDRADTPIPGGIGKGISQKNTSFNWPGHKITDANLNKPILQLGE